MNLVAEARLEERAVHLHIDNTGLNGGEDDYIRLASSSPISVGFDPSSIESVNVLAKQERINIF